MSSSSMMTRTATVRLGTRMARRELRRRPWRSALVVLMILIPTAGMTVITSFLRTSEWSAADRQRAVYGRADATAHLDDLNDKSRAPGATNLLVARADIDALRAGLPAGSRVIEEHKSFDRARDGSYRSYVTISDLALDNSMVDGRFTNLRGRLPRTDGETVITESTARNLALKVGDRFLPQHLGYELTVVGTIRMKASNDGMAFIGDRVELDNAVTEILIDLPDQVVRSARASATSPTPEFSYDGVSRSSIGLPSVVGWRLDLAGDGATSNGTGVFWSFVIGGVGLIVLGIIITAAFAVGARRQLRTIGLLASSGASPSVVRWFLVAQGIVAGLVGSVGGIVVGAIGAHLTPDRFLTSFANRPVSSVTTRLVDLVPIVILGTLTAAVAAWLPARTAADIPTLAALAGRRPQPRVPARVPVRGVISILGGCVLFAMAVAGGRNAGSSQWALVAVGGALAVLLGAVSIAPWLISGLEGLSNRLPQTWRLAARSLARSRTRSSAVVGAICAISAAVIAGATLYNSYDGVHHGVNQNFPGRSDLPWLRGDQMLVNSYSPEGGSTPVRDSTLASIAQIAPRSRALDLSWVTTPTRAGDPEPYLAVSAQLVNAGSAPPYSTQYGSLGSSSPELLDALQVPESLRAALGRGEAIAINRQDLATTEVLLSAQGPTSVRIGLVPLGGSFDSPVASQSIPSILVGRPVLDRFGLGVRPSGTTLIQFPSEPSGSQLHALNGLVDDINWDQGFGSPAGAQSIYLQLPDTKGGISPAYVKAVMLALSLLLILAVVAIGLALAARDTEDERKVLSAVGAAPATLRRVGTVRAVLLVLTAAVIAVPAALVPSAAIVATASSDRFSDYPFRPDFWALAFVILVVPIVVAATSLAGSRIRDIFRRTRPETFSFAD